MARRRMSGARRRWNWQGRTGRGKHRVRTGRPGRQMRLVLSAPRGIEQDPVIPAQTFRYRQSRVY